MKTKNTPLLLLIPVIAFASCKSNETARVGIGHEQLASAYAEPAIQFSKVKVSCKLTTSDGKEQTLAPFTLVRGKPVRRSFNAEEQIVPTRFDFPLLGKKDLSSGSFPVSPANPTAFEVEKLGWSMELQADAKQSFIMLSGSLTETRPGRNIRAGGLPYQPIPTMATDAIGRDVEVIITDNRAERPSLVTEEFPILIAAQPGKTTRVFLDEGKQSYATFTCKIID